MKQQIEHSQLQKISPSLVEPKRRYQEKEQGFWGNYKQDVDRIIYSKAFSRYSDKTQVIYLVENDHLTHRALHVQLVSAYSRGVASMLGLNIDLVEAIALGHDVGHCPFGHEGEKYLSDLSIEFGLGAFSHARQSCRLLSDIEPLNLTFEVLDGFLCHDGGLRRREARPNLEKGWKDHDEEMRLRLTEPEADFQPATFEGCLVKMCDTVCYVGKDIEDAIQMGIIKRDELPKTLLGKTNREILDRAAQDLVKTSKDTLEIQFSEEIFESLKALRRFNFERIYYFPKLKVESEKIKASYRLLAEKLLDDFDRNQEASTLWKSFLHSKEERYMSSNSKQQYVVDFIAGMTDRYFVKTLEKLTIPQSIQLVL